MPYWKYATYKNNAPSFPLYVYGETFDFSMMFVNDTSAAFANAYIYVAREFLGVLQAKLGGEGESAYQDISCNGDPSCYLGYLPVGEQTIDFRLLNEGDLAGVRNLYIPVWVAHDDGAPVPNQLWFSTEAALWRDCYNHIIFWHDDYGNVDTSTACTGADYDSDDGMSDSVEPGLFEDSGAPLLWQ